MTCPDTSLPTGPREKAPDDPRRRAHTPPARPAPRAGLHCLRDQRAQRERIVCRGYLSPAA